MFQQQVTPSYIYFPTDFPKKKSRNKTNRKAAVELHKKSEGGGGGGREKRIKKLLIVFIYSLQVTTYIG